MIQFDQTMMIILLATGILGFHAGIIGSFLVLQKKCLFGDSIAHATLPGLTAIFFFTLSKNPWILLCGATCSAIIAAIIIDQLERHTTLKRESLLGIVLASSFGIGTVFLSKIQTIPNSHQAGIHKYLLGNASTMLHQDLYMIMLTTLLSSLCIVLTYQSYKTILFDHNYAATRNIPTKYIRLIMLLITTITIVIGLQTVGVILMSALLIAPACAARQWTHHYGMMLTFSAFFGILATTAGTIISSSIAHMPTGPTIVLVASCITLISILIAPYGVLFEHWRKYQQMKHMNAMTMLSNFLLFNEGMKNPYHAHDLTALKVLGKQGNNKVMHYLEKQGFIESPQHNFWRLTPQGLAWLQQHNQIQKK